MDDNKKLICAAAGALGALVAVSATVFAIKQHKKKQNAMLLEELDLCLDGDDIAELANEAEEKLPKPQKNQKLKNPQNPHLSQRKRLKRKQKKRQKKLLQKKLPNQPKSRYSAKIQKNNC